jgi:uncharacterized RDD family membrane protein YckC
MSERPGDSGGLSSGDPLSGGTAEPPLHESGLAGYTSPPPPGAGGPVSPAFGQTPALGGRYVLAGWWSRVGAALIDGLIISVGALILFIPFGALFSVGVSANSNAGLGTAIAGLVVWVLCVTLIALLYAPVLMSRTNGKTFGRMACGIRVVRTSGAPITFWFAVLREVVVKSLLFGIAGTFTAGIAPILDVLWPLWDEEHRALHDFVVNTRVVVD